MAAYLVPNGYSGYIAEVTRGTTPGSGTVFWVPVSAPQTTPNQTFLRDEALRGSPGALYDEVQGVRHDEFDGKYYLYASNFPVFAKALLGGTDTVTTTTASYSHSIPLLNSASTGSQPLSYSICDFDGANSFVLPGAQASDLTLTFGAEVAAEAQVKWITNTYSSATTPPAPFNSLSFDAEHLIPSWDSTITIAATPLTYIASGELKLDRKTAPIFTMGSSTSFQNFAGGIDVTGKFTAVVNSNADPFSTGSGYAFIRSPQALVITLTDPNDVHTAINDSVSFQMSAVQFQMVKRVRGKEYLELEVEFHAEANTTDAASGYSPLKFTGVNGVAAAF